jgi:hypothetical protein
VEQFRLGHAPWFPNRGGIIANRAPQAVGGHSYPPPAVTAITVALRANHRHHNATIYRQEALSLALVLVGVATDTPVIAGA